MSDIDFKFVNAESRVEKNDEREIQSFHQEDDRQL